MWVGFGVEVEAAEFWVPEQDLRQAGSYVHRLPGRAAGRSANPRRSAAPLRGLRSGCDQVPE
jgi:hypothetical protein